jgi:hypothetical protein
VTASEVFKVAICDFKMNSMNDLIVSKNLIESKILIIRGERVMLDSDLAKLYGVETRTLNQAVKRNMERFPNDFMFQLSKNELKELITNCDNLRSLKYSPATPYAFTEQGVAMLSSVLNSTKAIRVNIAIMRIFVLTRKMSFSYEILDKRLSAIEKKYGRQDEKIGEILETIKCLIRGNINNRTKVVKGFEG